MGKLNTKQVVLTLTIFIGVLYLVCALFVFLAPATTLAFFNNWFHGIDLAQIAKTPEISEVGMGLVTALIVTSLFAMLFVALWNYFNERNGGKK